METGKNVISKSFRQGIGGDTAGYENPAHSGDRQIQGMPCQ
jgi:hypothetical protein